MEALEDRRVLSGMADIVFLVDGSGSGDSSAMRGWLKDYLFAASAGGSHPIAQVLSAAGITDIRYGLIGYGDSLASNSGGFAHSYVVDSSGADRLFGDAAMLNAALENFQFGGDGEDALDAIEHLIAEYRFRPGAVAAAIVLQNVEGRNQQNSTLTRDGILAALESNNVLVNYLGFGSSPQSNTKMFDLAPYGGDPNVRILGVKSDVADGVQDGRHDYVGFNITTGAESNNAGATQSDTLQISYNGTNTGATGMVGSGKSVLISQDITGGIGPSTGYRAKSVPFDLVSMSSGTLQVSQGVAIPSYNFSPFSSQAVYVNANGTITFGAPLAGGNVDLSYDSGSRPSVPMIAPLWDSLRTFGTVKYKKTNVDGQGPANDDLVVEWTSLFAGDNNPADTIRFQAILFSNGNIRFNYIDLDSYPAYIGNSPDNDGTVYESGGINATVGIWKGAAEPFTIPAGKFVPGPHSIFGSVLDAESPLAETNDAYIRLAWDTGGAVWDLGVIDGVDLLGANLELARTRLRDVFIASLAEQINGAAASGKVAEADNVLMAIDFGATSATTGADGFTGDNIGRIAPTPVPTIDTTSNSIPFVQDPPHKVNGVFQHARRQSTTAQNPNLDLSYDLPNGAYVVELFFAPIVSAGVFDVLIEGKTVLNNYFIANDRGRITTFDAGGGVPSEFELDVAPLGGTMPAGTVKRFYVDVSDADNDGNLNTIMLGLQIRLHAEGDVASFVLINGLRILSVGPPRVADVKLFGIKANGSAWTRPAYSYGTDIVPEGRQLAPIVTSGVNQLQVVFSKDMNQSLLTNDNVKLYRTGTQVALPAVSYVSATRTATWTFASVLPADKYRLEISDLVTDLQGNKLDGEWDNLTNGTPDNFADDPQRVLDVGNGVAGTTSGHFEFFFSLLPGDRNQDGVVNSADNMFGITQFDVNGDGDNNQADTDAVNAIIAANQEIALPVRYRGGDYNDDEIVSQFDYSVWKMTLGDTQPLANGWWADGNGDGTVNLADYTSWRNPLGTRSVWYDDGGSGGAGGGIPIVLFGEAPRVANVTISGSNSIHAPYSFDAHDGSGQQLYTVPVGGADTISIAFTEDVNISAATLKLTGLRTANRPALAEFNYDLGTMTATWRFTGWTANDHYVISLSDAVTDVEGNPLDGEWTNPSNIVVSNPLVSEFPSGDGTAGGDFNFVVTLLAADAQVSNVISINDYYIIYGNSTNPNLFNALFTQGDTNGDGLVDAADLATYSATVGTSLTWIVILGDLNGDHRVDEADGDILYNNWLSGVQNPTHAQGDLDGDHDIDIYDLDLMFARYGLELDLVS
jgi:hypothetical protein